MWANRALLQTNWPDVRDRAAGLEVSAGLLMYRRVDEKLQFFIMHPGGAYFADHDLGTWTIPRGEVRSNESLLNAACRRFAEVGLPAFGPFVPLRIAVNRHGIVMHAWAVEAPSDTDAELVIDTTIHLRRGWFGPDQARLRLDPAQAPWIDEVGLIVRSYP